jgi:spectinomycin phosphotransferase
VIEPPDIALEEILDRLRARWHVEANAVEFLPIGNDSGAWVFRVTGSSGAWFLKLRKGPVNQSSLAVPRFLADRGVGHMVAPVPTSDGAMFDGGDEYALILYPFIEGESGGKVGMSAQLWTGLGGVLRRIHDTPLEGFAAASLRREDFQPPLAEVVREIGRSVGGGAFDEPFERALAAFWRPRRAEIDAIVDRAEALGQLARVRAPSFVICHADSHAWNVLVDPSGEFVLVDWDETLLAPRERDLMFVGGGVDGLPPDPRSFYAGYGAVEIDPVVLAYCRYRWVVEELGDYAMRVFLTPDAGPETRSEGVEGFASVFEPGRVVETAYRSEEAIRATAIDGTHSPVEPSR